MLNKKKLILIYPFILLFIGLLLFAVYSENKTYNKLTEDLHKIDHTKDKSYVDWQAPEKPAIHIIVSAFAEDTIKPKYEIDRDELRLLSNSDDFPPSKLEELYQNFLKNGHGKELNYIDSILLTPKDKWPKSLKGRNGFYNEKEMNVTLMISTKHFILPQDNIFTMHYRKGLIHLLSDKDIADLERTLTHEYGHHYTFFYMKNKDEFNKYKEIRGFTDNSRVKIYPDDTYLNNHKWDTKELAAEDYVQLMGGFDKKVGHYIDTEQALDRYISKGINKNPTYYDRTYINVFPQENFYFPLADEVKGLSDYYWSFIASSKSQPEHPSGRNIILDHKKVIENGRTHWKFSWTPIEKNDANILYTLLEFREGEEQDYLKPIKTVNGSESLQAIIGNLSKTVQKGNFWWNDNLTNQNNTYFKVIALYPDGYEASSVPIKVDFNQ